MCFLQKCSSGQLISGLLLCEKELFFNEKLNGENSFQASSGWLQNIKLHRGIREIGLHREKLSACMVVANNFRKEFERTLELENMKKNSFTIQMRVDYLGDLYHEKY